MTRYASLLVTAMLRGILFSGCPSVHPLYVKAASLHVWHRSSHALRDERISFRWEKVKATTTL